MELSARVEYALAALIELASQTDQNELLQIKRIATCQGIPNRYLEQIFSVLSRAGIIRSQRGIGGGYQLARKPQQITLLEILECFETNRLSKQSHLTISTNRSIVREVWKEAHLSASQTLNQLTLQDLYQQRLEREQINNMYYI